MRPTELAETVGWARVTEGEHAELFAPPAAAESSPADEPERGARAPPFPRMSGALSRRRRNRTSVA